MENDREEWTVRPGVVADVPAIHQLIVDLAIYERAELEVVVTVETLMADGFGPEAIYELEVAESDVDGSLGWLCGT